MSTVEPSNVELALAKNTHSKKGRVISWALWDWGTQPFYTVITTFVFAVYITTGSYFSADPNNSNGPTQALSISTTLAGIVIAVIAPVLGQTADRSGHLVRNLRWMTWALALISMALFFVKPSPSYLVLGLILLGVGSIIGEISQSFYNATIDQVATEKNVGKISGFGWGMGYLGGILVLLLILVLFIQPEVGLFGVTDTPSKIRASMIVCGVWVLVFTIPSFLALKDRPKRDDQVKLGVGGAYMALFRSIAHLWKSDRQVAYFLLASAIFRDGLAAIFSFGAVIAAQAFGFTTTEIIFFGAAANLIAGVVTILFGLLDDKIGPKKVILICLGILTIGAVVVFFLHQPAYAQTCQAYDTVAQTCPDNPNFDMAASAQGKTIFWIFGLVLSCLCGPAQAASRSFLARIIPDGHSGEIFGLYTTTGRVISFISPALFGVAVTVGAGLTGSGSTQHWGLLAIALVLAAGFCVLLPVKAQTTGINTPKQ